MARQQGRLSSQDCHSNCARACSRLICPLLWSLTSHNSHTQQVRQFIGEIMVQSRKNTGTKAKNKQTKRWCSTNKDWESVYPWVKPAHDDSQSVFCELCQSGFSVSDMGEYDVKWHSQCQTHRKNVAQIETSCSMEEFLLRPKDDLRDKMTAAEMTSVYHTAQHSLSYWLTDWACKLALVTFPDLNIAKKMSRGRSKAVSIVTDHQPLWKLV